MVYGKKTGKKRTYGRRYKRGNRIQKSLQTIASTSGLVKCEAYFTISSYAASSILYRSGTIDQGYEVKTVFADPNLGGSLTFSRYSQIYQAFKITGVLLEVWPLLDPSTLASNYTFSSGYSLPLVVFAFTPTQTLAGFTDGTVTASDDTLTMGPTTPYGRKYWSLRGKTVFKNQFNMVGTYCDTINASALTPGAVKFLNGNAQSIASAARQVYSCKLTLYVDFAVTQDPTRYDVPIRVNAPADQPSG